MRALILSLALCAAPAFAQSVPSDVPDVGGDLTEQGLCLTPAETLTLAQRLEADKATIVSLKAAPQGVPTHLVVIGAIVAVVAVGAASAIGYGLGERAAVKK